MAFRLAFDKVEGTAQSAQNIKKGCAVSHLCLLLGRFGLSLYTSRFVDQSFCGEFWSLNSEIASTKGTYQSATGNNMKSRSNQVQIRFALLALAIIPAACLGGQSSAMKPHLIPTPKKAAWMKGTWNPKGPITLSIQRGQEASLDSSVNLLRQLLPGLTLSDQPNPAIRLDLIPGSGKPEGFTLKVSPSRVTITGSDAAGAYYGVQTLRQLVTRLGDHVSVTACEITDWPSFPLRGFMHDVGRNFQTIESLKRQIDIFAAYRINTFHWHLTDNPGWRIECLAYPRLNDPKHHTRDHGLFYSYSEIRDLISYARQRHVKVIPELDMPGHSAYFNRAFGFGMGSEEGRAVLEVLIDEFCSQISKEDCPMIHLGSDEVHIEKPDEFMARMTSRLRAHGRQAMAWNPGLKVDKDTLIQVWTETEAAKVMRETASPFVDSANGYLNNYDPLKIVHKYFTWQPCFKEEADQRALGGILCCWPDVRVEDKANIFRHNPVWPGLLAFSEALWRGGPSRAGDDRAFAEFEDRLAHHRDTFFKDMPFPFVRSSFLEWQAAVGSTLSDQRAILSRFSGSTEVQGRVKGGFIDFREVGSGSFGMAQTWLFSPSAQTIRAWIGFESPARSNRQSGGIPAQGEWTAFGAKVWVNGAEVAPPVWKNPNTRQYLKPTWSHPAAEDPYEDEEFYWTREPAALTLKEGWNRVLVRVPKGYPEQRWTFTFVPVKQGTGGRWIEDERFASALRPSLTAP